MIGVLIGCSPQAPKLPAFSAPPLKSVEAISSVVLDRVQPVEVNVDQDRFEQVLNLLDGADHDPEPAKWQSVGEIQITTVDNQLELSLYKTDKDRLAFRYAEEYYVSSATASDLFEALPVQISP